MLQLCLVSSDKLMDDSIYLFSGSQFNYTFDTVRIAENLRNKSKETLMFSHYHTDLKKAPNQQTNKTPTQTKNQNQKPDQLLFSELYINLENLVYLCPTLGRWGDGRGRGCGILRRTIGIKAQWC